MPIGTTVKFFPQTGTDTTMKNGHSQCMSINICLQCITCMREYESKSLEELRFEDYQANRKGGGAQQNIFIFGSNAFGNGNTGFNTGFNTGLNTGLNTGFGAGFSTSNNLFGNLSSTNSTFGSASTGNLFGFPLISAHSRLNNPNNISTTINSSISSENSNNMSLATLETQMTEMMSQLNDLSLNLPQQTQTPSLSSSTTTLPLLSDVLQHFQCPFEHDPELLCGYYERHAERGVCPFSHLLDSFYNGIELTQLPLHLCLNYLLNECTNLLVKSQSSQLVRCPDGLHLSSAQLVDKKKLYEILASEVLNMDAQQRQQAHRNDKTKTVNQTVLNQHENADQLDTNITFSNIEEPDCCSICHTEYTSVVAFGLLENCDHVFCADCILMWYQSQSDQGSKEKTCPYCRLESTRLIIWSKSKIESAEQKTAVFKLQNRCFRLWNT